jgi:hypothetical protein
LSNTIDLNAFNLFNMNIIRLDAWSNHCSDISISDVFPQGVLSFVLGVVQACV